MFIPKQKYVNMVINVAYHTCLPQYKHYKRYSIILSEKINTWIDLYRIVQLKSR